MAEAKDAARAAPDTDTDGYVSVPIQLPESGTEKFMRMMKEDPLVPIGTLCARAWTDAEARC